MDWYEKNQTKNYSNQIWKKSDQILIEADQTERIVIWSSNQ